MNVKVKCPERGFSLSLFLFSAGSLSLLLLLSLSSPAAFAADAGLPGAYPIQEGYVDSAGVLIYYKTFGSGPPLLIVHGGPGASHDYFLPHLIPLARKNRLVFIDERGSGRSQRLEDAKLYTVENMADDVEAVRRDLRLGKINLLGHSYGGVLAQVYAFKYEKNLSHLILCSTFHSTKAINKALADIKAKMDPALRARIDKMEKEGLYGKGKPFERNRYSTEYMTAAWAEGYFPYLYQNRPDANYDPSPGPMMGWEVYREMWGSTGEYVVDGNLVSAEYADRLKTLKVPTLITVGDHDESAPWISEEMQKLIADSKLVVLPKSGHMTFVDQPNLFMSAIDDFLHPAAGPKTR